LTPGADLGRDVLGEGPVLPRETGAELGALPEREDEPV